MAESAVLLVDEVFPEQPGCQWVLSVPYPLRFLFASRPGVMGRLLSIVYDRWGPIDGVDRWGQQRPGKVAQFERVGIPPG